MTPVSPLEPPAHGDDWLALHEGPLPSHDALSWATRSDCGAVVMFAGTVRDHAEGRTGVTHLDYEAYEEQVVPKLADIADETRRLWPDVGRVVLLHRLGTVPLGDPSVLVVVSTPHRAEAFEAARFAIDTLKASVPLWKREHWADGDGWGLGAHELAPAPGATTSEHRG
jgi:molybdopterin synthase catalytic subunit